MIKMKQSYILKVLFIIFIVVLFYFGISLFTKFNSSKINIYEVSTGEIVNVDRHKGLIYREEEIAKCKSDGYINFYVANADRVSRGSFIYTINDTKNVIDKYDLNDNDINSIKQNIKMYSNSITDINFSNIYAYKENIKSLIDEINIVKQLENIDIEKEIDAKEKGYAKSAGIVSFIIDGMETNNVLDFNDSLIRNYTNTKEENERNIVKAGDSVYKIIKNPEFYIAFDSDFDYDEYNKQNFVNVKFVYDNISAKGKIISFIGNDKKKHFLLSILDYPEKFIDKRLIEFEIENKKVSGYKVPIKSLVSKNCYMIPKTMIDFDMELDENVLYKNIEGGQKEKISFNISKEDDKYVYISIDDYVAMLKYGDVLSNRYGDTYSLSDVKKLDGVYNMNKGYAVFKNVDIIDKTNEYAIVKKGSINGISLYDHIALNASEIDEGDLIAS